MVLIDQISFEMETTPETTDEECDAKLTTLRRQIQRLADRLNLTVKGLED